MILLQHEYCTFYSNAHLRSENEQLSKKFQSLTEELQTLRASTAPLETAMRKLKTEKEALELTNDELANDIEYWRDRLQKLVSRYNDVDPEEHRLIKVQVDELSAALTEATKKLESAEDDKRVALAEVEQSKKDLSDVLTTKEVS